ncbi:MULTISPECIES: tRNA 5-hydroxyuridine modification protein YegQ [Nitrosomonas]|uniref:Peptidase family U32 n=1 Tax=Nitrosomonas europaea (strain ATCC 19718 / CIP 103999 / KCTC 2705 / NBRC 14298) TaxID=228410 RepID=Q82TC1_NITEU|nr:Peptidase family U32 [Nitrosomonas europaea ATCC 19718]SDW42357.1 putative protease [Nitrosomonas europaea]SET00919.1 putative protease [Nitrosomonas europaea]SJZ50179.1 putative protease [Nitrosomonas europaea]HBF25612.1 U32 family peptidase [Nitrosomonas sp.]
MLKAPELLLPAGSLEKMRAAYAFGADAVYAGQPRYSLRARNNEFTLPQLCTGITEAHQLGKKFFVASNLMPHNSKVKTYLRDMAPVIELQPDALIMADPGLIMMVRETWPDVPIHLSVQANTVNYAAVKFWQSLGLTRVILSRELSLEEISEIRTLCPDMELEVFVHGALCIAYSGRCLLSGYFNHRDPNQGTCTNSCRWDYKVKAAEENASGDIELPQKIDFDFNEALQSTESISFSNTAIKRHPAADQVYLIEESQRPGQLMPVMEDEHGTYIMNSKDLRAVEHVAHLTEIGIDSLKVEGRTKSAYYVARTAQVYRQAVDDAVHQRPFDPALLGQLEGLANRGYTDGFYQRHHSQETQNYLRGHSESSRSQYVGDIEHVDATTGMAEILVKNRFQTGDRLEIVHPSGNRVIQLEQMQDLEGNAVSVAPGSGHRVRIPLSGDIEKAFVARFL